MKTTDHWKTQAKQLIRAEMKRRSLSYADLASRMQALGLAANERTLANKIAAGGFSAAFFLQCMEAIGVRAIYLDGVSALRGQETHDVSDELSTIS